MRCPAHCFPASHSRQNRKNRHEEARGKLLVAAAIIQLIANLIALLTKLLEK